MRVRRAAWTVLVLVLACACEEKAPRPAASDSVPKLPAKASATAVTPRSSAETAGQVAPSATAAPETGPPRISQHRVENLPQNRSKVPTVVEWNAAEDSTNQVRVREALANCDVKLVREWLRVTCRETPGPHLMTFWPDSVTVTRGKDSETYTFESDEVASVVLPLVSGVAREVVIKYRTLGFREQVLTVEWPPGDPRPVVQLVDREPGAGGAPNE